VVDPAFEPRLLALARTNLAAAPPPLVMPAIVPGRKLFCAGATAAVAASAHARRRFLFPIPHHPHVADTRHAAVVLQSAAPPACSVPFYTRTNTCRPHEPGTTTASTP
jgi:hypothetical protein